MRALEFETRIKNNKIQIPDRIQSELKQDKNVRVIVLFEDSENYDDQEFRQQATGEFLKGYSESDSIYDQT
jgi:hypothetical protein